MHKYYSDHPRTANTNLQAVTRLAADLARAQHLSAEILEFLANCILEGKVRVPAWGPNRLLCCPCVKITLHLPGAGVTADHARCSVALSCMEGMCLAAQGEMAQTCVRVLAR